MPIREPTRILQNGRADPAQEARLEDLLARLYGFHDKEIDLSLNRVYRFLEKLGNPHLRLPKTVHIAGTNGKGSTLATLRALLEASGHAVHAYTSPHLVHPTERIVLAGQNISTDALCDLLTECIEINENEPVTFFELFTCAALLAFSRTPADVLLLEVGMGGRLDATNVVHDPVATIITTISYDHVSFLGDTIEKIAGEKAGIMKAGAPCILGHQIEPEAVTKVILEKSTGLSPAAPVYCEGADWSSAPAEGRIMFRFGDKQILLPRPNLQGDHQIWNAGAALAAFRLIAPDHFKPEVLSTALARIDWPGRLQTLENHPYNDLVPEGWDIVVDGAHNDSGGLVLAAEIARWKNAQPDIPIYVIVAMVDRKDAGTFLSTVTPLVDSLTLTRIPDEATSYMPGMLTDIARGAVRSSLPIYTAETPDNALCGIVENAKDTQARILICGSLYLMGYVLKRTAG